MARLRSKRRAESLTLTPQKVAPERRMTRAGGPPVHGDILNVIDMEGEDLGEDQLDDEADVEEEMSPPNHVAEAPARVLRSHQPLSSPDGVPLLRGLSGLGASGPEGDQSHEAGDSEVEAVEPSVQYINSVVLKKSATARRVSSKTTKEHSGATHATSRVALHPSTIAIEDSAAAGHPSRVGLQPKTTTAGVKRGAPSKEAPIPKRQRTAETGAANSSMQETKPQLRRKVARKTIPPPPPTRKKLPRPKKGPEDMVKAKANRNQKAVATDVRGKGAATPPRAGSSSARGRQRPPEAAARLDDEEDEEEGVDGSVGVAEANTSPEQPPNRRQTRSTPTATATPKPATRSRRSPPSLPEMTDRPASSPGQTGKETLRQRPSERTSTSKPSSGQHASAEMVNSPAAAPGDVYQTEVQTETLEWEDDDDFRALEGATNGSWGKRLDFAFEGVQKIRRMRGNPRKTKLVKSLLASMRKMRDFYATLAEEEKDSENYDSLCKKLDNTLQKGVDRVCDKIILFQKTRTTDLVEEESPGLSPEEKRKKEDEMVQKKFVLIRDMYLWAIPGLVLTVKSAMDCYKDALESPALTQIITLLDWINELGNRTLRPRKLSDFSSKREVLRCLDVEVLYHVRILQKALESERERMDTYLQMMRSSYLERCRQQAKEEEQLERERMEREIRESHIRMNRHIERLQAQKDSKAKQLYLLQKRQANRHIGDSDDSGEVERVRMFHSGSNTTRGQAEGSKPKEWLHDELLALANGLERFTGKDRYVRIARGFCRAGEALQHRDMDDIFTKAREFKADLVNDAEQHPERGPLPDWVLSIQ